MSEANGSELLEAALSYAGRGWRVAPLHHIAAGKCSCSRGAKCPAAGKHPLISEWQHRATTAVEEVAAWWEMWPTANIGIVTGEASGIVALDVDPRHGGDDTLAEHERDYHPLPETVRVLTGGGGTHYLFSPPPQLGNSAGGLGPGLDIRGHNGIIVAPPSRHLSGRAYEWDGYPSETPVASMPDFILGLIRLKRRTTRQPLSRIPAGERNTALARMAGAMAMHGMSPATIATALHAENAGMCDPPLPSSEVDSIAKSAAKWTANAAPWIARPGAFIDDERLTPPTRMVLTVLTHYANAAGEAHPGYRTIARRSGVSHRSVSRHVQTLVDCGRITVDRKRTGNRYRVLPWLSDLITSKQGGAAVAP